VHRPWFKTCKDGENKKPIEPKIKYFSDEICLDTKRGEKGNHSKKTRMTATFSHIGVGVGCDLVVVLLEEREILARLGELHLFHALADLTVDKRTLGVREIELVVEARPRLRDRGGV
jgi:hypothetical protein